MTNSYTFPKGNIGTESIADLRFAPFRDRLDFPHVHVLNGAFKFVIVSAEE